MPTTDYRTDRQGRIFFCKRVSETLPTKRRDGGYYKLVADIEEHGFRKPLILEVDGPSNEETLCDGHHRVAAAVDLRLTHIPVSTDMNPLFDDDDEDWTF